MYRIKKFLVKKVKDKGNCLIVCNWKQNLYFELHDNGVLKCIGMYKNNKLNGAVRWMHANQLLWKERLYKGNYYHGKEMHYSYNGSKKTFVVNNMGLFVRIED